MSEQLATGALYTWARRGAPSFSATVQAAVFRIADQEESGPEEGMRCRAIRSQPGHCALERFVLATASPHELVKCRHESRRARILHTPPACDDGSTACILKSARKADQPFSVHHPSA